MSTSRISDMGALQIIPRLGWPSENPLTYAEEGICVMAYSHEKDGRIIERETLHWMQISG